MGNVGQGNGVERYNKPVPPSYFTFTILLPENVYHYKHHCHCHLVSKY